MLHVLIALKTISYLQANNDVIRAGRIPTDVVIAGQFFFFQTNVAKLTALKTLSIFQAASDQHFPLCCLPHPAGRANQDFRRLPPEQQVPQKHRSCASACTRLWLPDLTLRGRTRPQRRRLLQRREGQEGRVAAAPATAAARAPY